MAVRFILQAVSRSHGQFGAPFGKQPRRHLGRDFLWISLYIFVFLVLFLCISFVFYGFTKANYGGYTQAVLFFKYRQCIIIAPVIRRNFLCIPFVFYGFISYIFLYFMVLFLIYFFCVLRFYWSNYGGYTQVVSFFKYRQCLITAPIILTPCVRV